MKCKGLTPLTVLLLTVLLLTAPSVQAQTPEGDPLEENFFPPEMVMQHQRSLGLTADQKNTIKAAIYSAQMAFTDAQWQLLDETETMRRLVSEQRVKEQQALDQLEKILALERDIKRAQLTLMIQIKNTLTSEQQRRLEEAMMHAGDQQDGLWPW